MKKILIPVLLLLVLGGIALYLNQGSNSSTIKKEAMNFAVEDTGTIDKIFMADKAGKTILLEKEDQNSWTLNSQFPARMDAVRNLLSTMKSLRVKTPVPKAAFANVVKGIASSSVKVEIYQGGSQPAKVYYVGGANKEHSGTYMLLENSSVPFVMHIEGFHGYITPRYFTNENEWKSTQIFKYDYGEIESIQVDHGDEGSESFVIRNSGNDKDFSVAAPLASAPISNVDSIKLLQYISRFKKIHFEGFEETKDQSFVDSVLATTPMETYSVTDKSGKVRSIKTFLKPIKEGAQDLNGDPITHDIDRMYGLVDDTDFVVIQYYVFDPINWKLKDFTKG